MARTIRVANVNITAGDTEFRWEVPKGCKGAQIQCRTAVDVRMSHREGRVAGSNPPFFTIKSGAVFKENKLDTEEGSKLYFAAASAVVVEIIAVVEEPEEGKN